MEFTQVGFGRRKRNSVRDEISQFGRCMLLYLHGQCYFLKKKVTNSVSWGALYIYFSSRQFRIHREHEFSYLPLDWLELQNSQEIFTSECPTAIVKINSTKTDDRFLLTFSSISWEMWASGFPPQKMHRKPAQKSVNNHFVLPKLTVQRTIQHFLAGSLHGWNNFSHWMCIFVPSLLWFYPLFGTHNRAPVHVQVGPV